MNTNGVLATGLALVMSLQAFGCGTSTTTPTAVEDAASFKIGDKSYASPKLDASLARQRASDLAQIGEHSFRLANGDILDLDDYAVSRGTLTAHGVLRRVSGERTPVVLNNVDISALNEHSVSGIKTQWFGAVVLLIAAAAVVVLIYSYGPEVGNAVQCSQLATSNCNCVKWLATTSTCSVGANATAGGGEDDASGEVSCSVDVNTQGPACACAPTQDFLDDDSDGRSLDDKKAYCTALVPQPNTGSAEN